MLRTLVLLRMRCGCFDTEVEVGGGIEDSVWTLKTKTRTRLKSFVFLLQANKDILETELEKTIKDFPIKYREVILI